MGWKSSQPAGVGWRLEWKRLKRSGRVRSAGREETDGVVGAVGSRESSGVPLDGRTGARVERAEGRGPCLTMNSHLHHWSVSPEGFPGDGFVSDRLEYLLRYAILAPSPHNTQPWLFRINTNDVEVHADPRRLLRVTDPGGREMLMACGAALLNLRIAAEYFAQKCVVEVFPDAQQPMMVGRMTVHSGGEATSEDVVLFHAIRERRTNRGMFGPMSVAEGVMDVLGDAATAEGVWASFVTGEGDKGALADLVAEGDRRQWANREFRAELARWVRSDAERQVDGIPTRELGIQDWMAFAGPALVRTFDRGGSQAARDREIAECSPLLVVLGTDGDTPRDWVMAGQALERMLLVAQSEGVSVSHLSQPLEEAELRPRVAMVAGREAGFPQAVLRMGYGVEVPPTPRRDLRAVLLSQDPARLPPH